MTTAQVVKTSVTVNKTVLFRTTFTWSIKLNQLKKRDKLLLFLCRGSQYLGGGAGSSALIWPTEKSLKFIELFHY